MKRKSVDILLPCFNEEKTISTCIKRIRKVMDKTNYNYHIIVCDNNSFDKSREMSLKEKAKVIIENPTTGRSLLVLVILLVVSMASLIITKRYQKSQLSK